jgi:hypothetical protein
VAAGISALALRRTDQTRRELGLARGEIGEVRKEVNGKVDRILESKDAHLSAVAKLAHAEGVAEGVAAVVTPSPVVPAPPTPATVPHNRRREDRDAPVKVEVVPSADPLPVEVIDPDEPPARPP